MYDTVSCNSWTSSICVKLVFRLDFIFSMVDYIFNRFIYKFVFISKESFYISDCIYKQKHKSR